MKRNYMAAVALLAIVSCTAVSCGSGTSKQGQSAPAAHATANSTVLEVDSLLKNAETLVGQPVVVEGVCTHICQHGGGKIFLMGSDDTQTIRIDAGEKVGKFTPETVNSLVRINGTLNEERIDEAFLSQWEEQAKAQAGSYAQAGRMVVLIDEDKIERMAEDESYRKKYESLIANASSQMSQMGNSIASAGMSVKTYGMQVNDNGTATYFAVLEKSTVAQKERIEKKAQEKKAEKKAEARKEAKKAEKERLEKSDDTDTVTITASSLEELLQKIKDQSQLCMSDNVQTEAEKKVGQKFDYSV